VSAYDLVVRKELGDVEEIDGPVPDKFEIPEHLKGVPNDSDQVKKDKLKKIKRLKSKHRKLLMEQAGQQKKSSWQVFQNKGKTPLVVGGFLKGKKRKSIFASPDDLNGRVGVTGSGGKMTEYKDLTRHKFTKIGTLDDSNQPPVILPDTASFSSSSFSSSSSSSSSSPPHQSSLFTLTRNK